MCNGIWILFQGDSGGPLQVIGADDRWYQIGITSFGANDEKAMLDQGTYPGKLPCSRNRKSVLVGKIAHFLLDTQFVP